MAIKKNVWSYSATHKDYPSYTIDSNPSAYPGHKNQITDPDLRALAWLGNLHYWSALMLLDSYYSSGVDKYRDIALTLMIGPIQSLGRYLSKQRVGLPFDKLSAGSHPALASKVILF